MKIDYSCLASGPSSFRDGLDFLDDLRTWSEAYEKKCMVPDEYNHKLAEETIAILLCNVPQAFKGPGTKAVTVLMDTRLRNAMMYVHYGSMGPCANFILFRYPPPPRSYVRFVEGTLSFRKFVLRYLMPPRPDFLPYLTISKDADKETGMYHQVAYKAEPWYVFWVSFSIPSIVFEPLDRTRKAYTTPC